MRGAHLLTATFLLSLIVAVYPGEGFAMPSYARQSGVSCFGCHSQTSGLENAQLLTGEQSGKFTLEGLTVLSVAPSKSLKVGISVHTRPSWDSSFSAQRSDLRYYDPGLRNQLDETGNMAGFSGFVGSDLFLASIGLLNPSLGYALQYDGNRDSSVWYRLAFTPRFGGLNFTLGLFGSSNNTSPNNLLGRQAVNDFISAKSFGLDASVRGAIGPISVDLKTVYSNRGFETGFAGRNISKDEASDSFNAMAKIGFNKTFGLSAAYTTYGSFTDYAAYTPSYQLREEEATIGAWINLTDNVTVQPEYTTYKVDRQLDDREGEFKLRFFSEF
ncbi:hypothetical protein MNBD_NITROSPINAE03-1770 [hydrothermal vent metagenome]|uniref:Uncharacterized protein n=1 Tax=hydrothermal vent metagenome TaxID=652676 RepID=A0A3B1CNA1_9ZZZZ